MFTRGILPAVLTLSLAVPAVAFAQAESPAAAATGTAMRTYFEGCAAHLGRAADIKAVVQGSGFEQAHPKLTAGLLGGEAGEAWMLPEMAVGVTITVQNAGAVCRVRLREGSEAGVREAFSRSVESAASPGLKVDRVADDLAYRNGQAVRTLSYRLSVHPRRADVADQVLTLTTNPSPYARSAAVMTAAVTAPAVR